MMDWKALLCSTRIRDMETGEPSEPVSSREARSEFDRDYDRSVFSSPVRRLQDKAQVWPLERNDFVRTRLTHSLEVSAVARGLARRVAQELKVREEVDDDQAHSVQMIAATCGLLHDLGNPPFGHAGEEAMRAWFLQKFRDEPPLYESLGGGTACEAQDFLKFDGNPQTLRLVAHLQMLSHLSGLNLTAGTVSALMKYTAASNATEPEIHFKSKPGFFVTEADLVHQVRELTGTGAARHPIAAIVEASDDIVYSIVDLEDGLRKGAITWEGLQAYLIEEAPSAEETVKKLVERSKSYLDKGGLDLEGEAFVEAVIQIFRTYTITRNVEAASDAFLDNYETIMEGSFSKELLKAGETADLVVACKRVGRKHVYPAESILRLEVMGREVIKDLCDFFWEGVENAPDEVSGFSGKLYQLLSQNYRRIFERNMTTDMNEDYCRLQLVADYVSGMTDNFAVELHRQLSNG